MMTTVEKSLVEKVLNLPNKVKVRLVESLIESLDDQEQTELVNNAKLAHERIVACRKGKEESFSEEEIMALLDNPTKR